MRRLYFILIFVLACLTMSAQAPLDRKEVRAGNRDFRKGNFKEADIDYRRAIVKDSTSAAANYNLANTLYRMENYQEASKYAETAENTILSPEICFNKGNIALMNKDYNTAVEAFKQSLLMNPGDLEAKENYIYARKMLEDQQQNGGGGQNDQNQDNQDNQNNDQNQQNQDQNQDNNQNNQDQNDDQGKDNQDQNNDQNQNQDQDKPNQDNQNQDNQQPQLTQQAAQQMLQAIEAKEKETQDKVKKEKALQARSRQKEKNW